MSGNFQRPRRSFRERLAQFMYGRNGVDGLGRALCIFCLVIVGVNLFIGSFVLLVLSYALMLYALFRALSRNLAARRRENAAYYRARNRVSGFFGMQKNQWRDRKTHVYRKCPHCKKTLRLPKVKGEHTVNCPCCHHRFTMKV